MSLSQRIYKTTKAKLDKIQARFVLDRINGQKINLPELIDKMADFTENNFDQFKKDITKMAGKENVPDSDVPEFIRILLSSEAIGGPEDYKEYDFNDA